MARGSRPDVRTDPSTRTPDAREDRAVSARPPRVPMDRLALPRTDVRERVLVKDHVYTLRASEARTLATIGAFRMVPTEDLHDARGGQWSGDLQHLAEQGLIERTTVMVNDLPLGLAVLTRDGHALLEAKQETHGARQQYHAGFVKPREAAHDAQLHRLFEAEGGRIEAAGGRIERVVLDYELKREYQTFLHRRDRPADATAVTDRHAFAAAHGLSVIDGHLELPDLRIEYETADGRHEFRDVELVTEHYSRAQLAGKAAAGFSQYRASGAGGNRRGGTPLDPHHLEWLG